MRAVQHQWAPTKGGHADRHGEPGRVIREEGPAWLQGAGERRRGHGAEQEVC